MAKQRDQAASWYEAHAADATSGAFGRMSAVWAARIRNGDADHRLDAMIAGQAEYDAEQAA